jgi:PKHD-type hydroxylase
MIAMIPSRYVAGSSNTAFWENFLSDEDINLILSLPEWSLGGDASIGAAGNHSEVNREKRTTTVGWMCPDERTNHIWDKIINAVAEVNRTFFHYDLSGCFEPAQLGIYKSSDQSHYTWHCDDSPESCAVPRKLSMALLLDDPSQFEGGELQIMSQNETPISLEQKRGRAWFFPSWMLHRVTPVTKGTRRSLVLWVGGPAFR